MSSCEKNKEHMMNGKLLSVRQTSEILGISEKAVYQRVYRRQIPFRKMGRRVLISQEELVDFLAGLPGVDVKQALDSVR